MLNRRQGLQAAAAFAGLALSGGSARAQPAPAVVSLSEQRSRFFVDVQVDGASGYRFVLDTGATTHFISTKLVSALRLRPVEQRMVRGYAGRNRETVVGISRLNVGGVELGQSRAVAWAPVRLEEHDGLIGYPFLFPRAVVALGAGRVSLGGAAADGTPVRVRAEVARNQALLLGGVPGATGRFVFDTGSQSCTVSAAHYARVQQTEAYKSASKLVYRLADGSERTGAFRPAQMRFGDFVLDSPVVRIDQQDGRQGVFAGIDGLFGVNLLRPYTWIVDQAAGTLHAIGPAPARVGLYGSGLSVAETGGQAHIAGVVDHGPAFEAGVRPGQQVLSLTGSPSDGPGMQVLELIDRGARRTVELETRVLL